MAVESEKTMRKDARGPTLLGKKEMLSWVWFQHTSGNWRRGRVVCFPDLCGHSCQPEQVSYKHAGTDSKKYLLVYVPVGDSDMGSNYHWVREDLLFGRKQRDFARGVVLKDVSTGEMFATEFTDDNSVFVSMLCVVRGNLLMSRDAYPIDDNRLDRLVEIGKLKRKRESLRQLSTRYFKRWALGCWYTVNDEPFLDMPFEIVPNCVAPSPPKKE